MRKRKKKALLVLLLAVALMLQYTISTGFMSAYAGEEGDQTETTQAEPSKPETKEEAKPAPKNESTTTEKSADQQSSASNDVNKVDNSESNGGSGEPSETPVAGGTENPSANSEETLNVSADADENGKTVAGDTEFVEVTWANYDGSVLDTDSVEKGKIPSYDGPLPTKDPAESVSYTFSGWTPAVAEVTEDTTYTATYSEMPKRMAAKAPAVKAGADGYPATNFEEDVTGSSNNGFTKAMRAWRDADGNYYLAIASRDQHNEADDAYIARLRSHVGTAYTTVDVIDNNQPLVVNVENASEPFSMTPSKATGKKSDRWIVIVQTEEQFKEYADDDGKNFVLTNLPEINAGGFALHQITIPNTIDKYTVTWIDWDETVLLNEVDVYNYGDTPTYKNEDPVREGYEFTGWMPEISEVIRDIIYQAVYAKTYTVTYQYTGEEPAGAPKVPDPKSYKEGDSVPAAAVPSMEGYTFSGWSGEVSTMPAHDVTVTGSWSKNSHTVTYSYTEAPDNAPEVPDPKTYYYQDDVTVAEAPTMEGYSFSGWSKTGTFKMPDEDVAITGKWSKNSYTVTYSYTGDAPADAPAVPEPKTYEFEDAVPAAAVPSLEGYTFSGWSGEVSTMPAHNVTVTGSWTEVPPTPEPPTPTPTPTPGGGGGPAGGGGAAAAVIAATAAPAVVADNPVPLADPAVIEDTPAPLSAPEGNWALLNLIAAILASIGAIAALFRRKKDDEEGYRNEEDNRGRNMAIAKGLGVVCAAASVIAFILTEDMSLPMAMTDKWTLLMGALFAGQIATAVANKVASKNDEDEEGAQA